ARPWADGGRVDPSALVRGGSLRAGGRSGGGMYGRSSDARCPALGTAPAPLHDRPREAGLPRPIAARNHDRAFAGVLCREVRRTDLPDVRAADVRLQRALPPRGARRMPGGTLAGEPTY